ncbi:11241_t:CDS:2, partial [Entrophospora sp. SA101]
NILKETVDIYKCCIEIVREEKFNDSSHEFWVYPLCGNLVNIREASIEHVNEEKKSEEGTTHIQERRWGSFSRALSLPRNVKADDVVAKYENGVLEVKIPKAEQSGKKITSQ